MNHDEPTRVVNLKHAYAHGCEGVVSKQRGSADWSGRSAHWLKIKIPAALAVGREAEEDCNAPGR